MTVSQLVYLSRATMYVDRTELAEIAAKSAANNSKRGVTGALLFVDGYFLQILEGEGKTLDDLLGTIALDERHADVQIVKRTERAERQFAGWGMSCLHESAMSDRDAKRAADCVGSIADPMLVDRIGNDAHLLLVDLQDAIAREAKAA